MVYFINTREKYNYCGQRYYLDKSCHFYRSVLIQCFTEDGLK